ncbi:MULTISPECIES: M48 family metalloprotease [unclassified Nocardioides]|uniref:M48 family metalloprotease n=1 Tax=unclassified Nocardioides TaxID=2615069 RepID=UPI0009F0C643|nr:MULTISPECIES: M48 family metalloprotease [unclassified Nocardioides]GAW49772.1 Peptidase family M48 [Nocardioides sp. PD653-B2]GAW56488.1 Peptidase family M48 [Nocardioides sp. PD653]
MIAAIALLVFASLAVSGASLLANADWPSRAPALAIWAWQCLSGGAALALVFAGLAVALPETPLRAAVARALEACSVALARHYSTPGGLPIAVAALTISLFIVVRFGYMVTRDASMACRARRRQLATLGLVTQDHPSGFKLLPNDLPMVFCVPGRRPTVVVTRGAIEQLTTQQLDLVLAHERQHLHARHDLALTLAGALARTFGNRGLFQQAAQQIAQLAEMQADDTAHRVGDRRELAEALLRLSPSGRDLNAGATAATAVARVRRLAMPAAPLIATERYTAAVLGAALLGAPFGLALAPAVEAAIHDCCPVVTAEPVFPGQTAVSPPMHPASRTDLLDIQRPSRL